MKARFVAGLTLTCALVTGVLPAAPAFAASHSRRDTVTAKTVTAKAVADRVSKRRLPFTAVGSLVATDAAAGTATVAVRAGVRDLRGKTVTVAVTATTKIRCNDAAVALSALPAGARVTVVGTRAGTGLTASKLNASTDG
jgi:hypothetical protein